MEKSFWKELWLLLIFTALGLIVCVFASLLAMIWQTDSAIPLHIVQWAQTIFVMILPPIYWYIFRVKKSNPFVGFGLTTFDWRSCVLAAVFIIAAIPAFDYINYLNQNLPLPTAIEEMVKNLGESNELVLTQMLSLSGFFGWIELILLMSVFTAIGEELMFRGALLKCFSFTRLNRHWQAFLVGLIFSIIHFEPYGFIDRWILGSVLCYLVFWTGSLWPSIVLHATNNLIALIQYKCFEMNTTNNELQYSWYVIVLSFVVSIAILNAMAKSVVFRRPIL